MTEEKQRLTDATVRLTWPTMVGAAVLHGTGVAWVWGDGHRHILLSVAAVAVWGVNAAVSFWAVPRWGSSRAEPIRMVANLAGMLMVGIATRWAPPFWMWLPFMGVAVGTQPARVQRWGILVGTAMVMVGLWGGALPWLATAAVCSAVICERLTRAQMDLLAESMGARDQARVALELAHRKALEQEKLSSLGMLAAGVAHEVNNPMAYVRSNLKGLMLDLEALRTDPKLFEEYRREVLPATLDGVERVIAIAADLRRFSRAEPEQMVPYLLDEQVQAALRIARPKFGSQTRVELQLSGPASATGRPGQIVQVLVNLVVNAAQAVAGKGVVSVSTGCDADWLWVEVRDDGPGMSAETQRRLFEPFFTTKPAGEGTGLGLPLVRGIVQDHQGRIEVESELGKGTCFTVRLPREPLPTVVIPALSAPEVPAEVPAPAPVPAQVTEARPLIHAAA